MKVTIIQAPQMVTLSNYLTTVAIPPLGMAYVTASLEQAGHQIQFIDGVGEALTRFSPYGDYYLRGLPHEEIVARVDPEVELIAVGCMFTPQWPSVRALIDQLRAAHPAAPIVLGGEHATALPEYILESSKVDFIVLGEGEETIVALAQALEKDEPLEALSGIALRVGGKVQRNPARARIRDIDDLPWPAWKHIPVQNYIAYNQPHGAALGRSMPMLATRGCPYRCTYCSSPQMWTTKWVPRSVANVVDEIEYNVAAFGANDFHFEDLTAIVRKDWIVAFCKEIVDRGLEGKITWQLPSGTRSEAIDIEVMTWMKRAGAKILSYAPESGSERMLKLIKKRISLKHMMEAARDAVKCKMSLQANFVLGHHEETLKDTLQTYLFLIHCAWVGFTEVHLACFYPLPNTEDWEKLRAKGKLPEYSDELFLQIFQGADPLRPISWNEKFSDRQMQALILFGYALFYGSAWLFRPWRFVQLVWHLATGQATNKTERILRESFRKVRQLGHAQMAP
jgi:anaerobic magnesium-protoporphyrin IX monomethyl ester cyclase